MALLLLHIDWFLILSGVATVGIPTALVLYSVKRMRDLAGPHVELEPQHLLNIVLAFPTTEAALEKLEMLVLRADFRSPEARRDELRKLKSWLADQDLSTGAGYSVVLRQSTKNPGIAGPGAERLAEAQIRRLEWMEEKERTAASSNTAGIPEEKPWCVVGLVAAIAASIAEKLPEGSGITAACQGHDALKAAVEAAVAMDAFYLFYAPAPQERLTEDKARRLTGDLQAIAPSKP